MAIIKCKMCGGDLVIEPGMTVAECEYCGTKQTVPTADNEKKLTLFARANRLRFACEFDKAAGIYEAIAAEFSEEAEAYWGLVLCKYGIEYVDDPATGKKVPTCHRSSFDSVMDDPNFDQTLENADVVARKVYREEAKQIEELRKGILQVSANEEPYDIFICYKETDENGSRTLDSVLAQDIYDALTDRGYRVFFSRVTLEDKLGQEYEPYIFAALNSAKILLAVGTDYEYYNAVWVKNEWSRYLKLMTQDRTKHLIPCYKGIDAYDMPKEFAKLQAQDLGKVGAMQDLLRGIEKILPRRPLEAPSASESGKNNVSALLERGNMALEDEEWSQADRFFEEVLNHDAKNACAYVGKLCVQMHYHAISDMAQDLTGGAAVQVKLKDLPQGLDADRLGALLEQNDQTQALVYVRAALSLGLREAKTIVDQAEAQLRQAKETASVKNSGYFQKAMRFGDDALRQKLADYVLQMETGQKNARLEKQYQAAIQQAGHFTSEESIQEALKILEALDGYKDSLALAADYREKLDALRKRNAERLAAERARLLKERGDLAAIRKWIAPAQGKIAARRAAVGIDASGTVNILGTLYGKTENLGKLKAISTGNEITIGLREDGTVAVIGKIIIWAYHFSDWKNITAVAAGEVHALGLRTDGTVVADGVSIHGENEVSDWKDIVAIAAGEYCSAGLKRDGTVVVCGDLNQTEVNRLTDIVAISVRRNCLIALRKDGTVQTVGDCNHKKEISQWHDIVAVSTSEGLLQHTVALRADGRVFAAGYAKYGECNVEQWRDIVAVAAGDGFTLGLKADGTVVGTGEVCITPCNVSWKLFGKGFLKDPATIQKERRFAEELIAKREAELEPQRKRELAMKRDAQEKERAKLEKERAELEKELASLTGLFSGGQRKGIKSRLAYIDWLLEDMK